MERFRHVLTLGEDTWSNRAPKRPYGALEEEQQKAALLGVRGTDLRGHTPEFLARLAKYGSGSGGRGSVAGG